MIKFLKRHSMDLSKKNNKNDEKDNNNIKNKNENVSITIDKIVNKSTDSNNVSNNTTTNNINNNIVNQSLNDKDNNNNNNNEKILDKFKNNKDCEGKNKDKDKDIEIKSNEQGKNNNNDNNNNNNNNKEERDDDDDDGGIDPCKGLSFKVGVSENKNSKYRRTMEDVHTYVANFCERLDWGYFGVFDGHAGKQTARWAGTNLHNLLYDSIINDKFTDLRENLNSSFLEADKEIAKLKDVGSSGCTAAVAVLRWEEDIEDDKKEKEINTNSKEDSSNNNNNNNNKFDFIPTEKHKRILYTANVGDTRIVLNRNGKAKRLSYDHKGSDKNEIKRIYRNGGLVLGGRVNGVLAVSRSLGDIYLKEFVLGSPFTTMTEINKDDKFLIIACDGLWDVCSDQEAVNLIKNINNAKIASEKLCNYAIEKGTSDNVTVMVIILDSQIFGYTKM